MSFDPSKLQIVVSNFSRTIDFVSVTLSVSYLDEIKTFDATIQAADNKKSDWYARQALRQVKKEIKKWARDVSAKPSVIGLVVSVSPQDFEDDNITQ